MPLPLSRFSLRLYISCLFTVIIVLLGLLLIYAQHRQHSDFLLQDSERRLHHLEQTLGQRLVHNLHGIDTGLTLMRASGINLAGAESSPDRWWPLMRTLLDANPQAISFYLGEADGRGLFFRAMRTRAMRDFFKAPTGADWVMDITHPSAPVRRVYLGRDGQPLSSVLVDESRFDARTRPWFHTALMRAGTAITPPYSFYFLRQPGLTLSLADREQGRVFAADLLLSDLAALLGRDRPDARTLLLQAPEFRILASNLEHPPTEDGTGMPPLSALEGFAPLLERNAATWQARVDGRRWLGQQTRVQLPGGLDLRLVTLVPYQSLMAEALAFSRNQILLTLALILLTLPVVIWASRAISRPLLKMAQAMGSIQEFDFDYRPGQHLYKELAMLDGALRLTCDTLSSFTRELHQLARSRDFNDMLEQVSRGIVRLGGGRRCLIYRARRQDGRIRLALWQNGARQQLELAADTPPEEIAGQLLAGLDGHGLRFELPWLLYDRFGELNGAIILGLSYGAPPLSDGKRRFIEHYGEFANLALEDMSLFEQQKQMTESVVQVIASAIDAKSPYTSGHCQRVPELTLMLARAASEADTGPLAGFRLDEGQWEALRMAAWLHDCGKVVTPEHVIDKATKLETLYNRLHEIRMRFEVLKRDADIDYWRALAGGGDARRLAPRRHRRQRRLDQDFAFIAALNLGQESLGDEQLARLERIARERWLRTLDDTLGLSWEEAERRGPGGPLPVWEPLLADHPWHRIPYPPAQRITADNPWGITLAQPALRLNLGECYNLATRRGTLTAEERYTIQAHMVHTLIMLSQLSYPRHLSEVPLLAASHHERMDGGGYPRGVPAGDLPLTARMMALADVFEALTAADRPYKEAKTVGQSLAIMATMVRERHLDPELFRFFIERRLYLDYGRRFLAPAQLDEVDAQRLLAEAGL